MNNQQYDSWRKKISDSMKLSWKRRKEREELLDEIAAEESARLGGRRNEKPY